MADEMDLRDEDRLPWLETVDPDEREGPPVARVIALVVLGLGVLAAIIFGVYSLQNRTPTGDGQLIAAQEGPYKVKPDDAGGLKVNGEGDSAIATSAGKGAGNGAIDLTGVPEAPVAGRRSAAGAAEATGEAGRNAVAQVPESGGKLVAAAPLRARPATTSAATGGSLVQLGAFPSAAVANAAWTNFSKRFSYLAPLAKSVEPVARGGSTLYRLRVDAGGANQAAEICGRLRVAGETCFVAS